MRRALLVGGILAFATAPAPPDTVADRVAVPVAALVEGVLKAMVLCNIKTALRACVLVALCGAGAGFAGRAMRAAATLPADAEPLAERSAAERSAAEPVTATTGGRAQMPRRRPDVMGRITAIAKDAKAVTLEVAPAGRAEPAKTVDIKLTATTKLLFSGVGPGGAKLTEGHWAHVWTAVDAKNTAERIHVIGNRGDRNPPTIAGLVTGVKKDGKTLTIQVTPNGRAGAGTSVAIRLTDKTQQLYTNVAKGEAKPTERYRAEVWLADGAKDTASRVNFTGSAVTSERGVPVPDPDRAGRVVGMSKDGTVLTLAPLARERSAPAAKEEVKLADKTITAYFQVGPDSAVPTEGYLARAWLAAGSKDTAGKIIFHGVPKEPPTLHGKVTAIAKDGKSLTLEMPAKERGGEPVRKTIKLTPQTKLTFHNVGPDGAVLMETYVAQVVLEDGSSDTAAHVLLGPAPVAGERR